MYRQSHLREISLTGSVAMFSKHDVRKDGTGPSRNPAPLAGIGSLCRPFLEALWWKLERQCTSWVSMLHICSAMTASNVEGAASNDFFDAEHG
jgi:hypothetical protein